MTFRGYLKLMIVTARVFLILLLLTIILIIAFNLHIYIVVSAISLVVGSFLFLLIVNTYVKYKYSECRHYITFLNKRDGSLERRKNATQGCRKYKSITETSNGLPSRNSVTDPAYQGLWHNIYNDSQR